MVLNKTGFALKLWLIFIGMLVGVDTWAQAPTWIAARAVGGNYYEVTKTGANASGDIYLLGQFSGTTSFGSTVLTSNGYSGFLAKWSNVTNSFVWAKQIDFGRSDFSVGALAVSGTNVYMAGGFSGGVNFGNSISLTSGYGIYVAKLADAGLSSSFVWASQASSDGPVGVADVTATGASVYVVGSSNKKIQFGSTMLTGGGSVTQFFVAKLLDDGTAGRFTWASQGDDQFGSTASAVASNGPNVYISGTLSSTLNLGAFSLTNTNGGDDLFLAKLTDVGATSSFTWAQQSGGASGSAGPTALAVSDANVYVVGSSSGTTTFGNSTLASNGQFVVKLVEAGSTGNFTWAKQFKTHKGYIAPNTPYSLSLSLAAAGTSIYVAGAYNLAELDAFTLSARGSDDILVAKLNDTGATANFAWVQRGGGTGFDYAKTIAVASGGIVYVGGRVAFPAYFDNITLPGTQFGGFLASFKDDAILAAKLPAGEIEFTVFPNPAHARATLAIPKVAGASVALFTLRDELGRIARVYSVALTNSLLQTDLDLTGLVPGMYTLHGQTANKTLATRRLVIE